MPSPERDRDLFYSKSVDHDTLAIGVPEWRRHLSNFAEMPQPLELHGRRYRTVEHAYQAHKFIHVNDAAVADTFKCDAQIGAILLRNSLNAAHTLLSGMTPNASPAVSG